MLCRGRGGKVLEQPRRKLCCVICAAVVGGVARPRARRGGPFQLYYIRGVPSAPTASGAYGAVWLVCVRKVLPHDVRMIHAVRGLVRLLLVRDRGRPPPRLMTFVSLLPA